MNRNKIILIAILNFCFFQNILAQNVPKTDAFLGDSSLGLGYEKYFKSIASSKGNLILDKQNSLYQKKFTNLNKSDLLSSNLNKVKFKLVKQILNKKEYRIVLYSLLNNIKRDSIEFYRSKKNATPNYNYTCLSYLDLKHNAVWQIKYFTPDSEIISYKRIDIKVNGSLQSDTLFYLDESLDVEMSKYKLYFK
ncbi:hypothetical protein PQ462_09535 [Flavobacterium sp. KACC 22758]|uniref:hypothetical protein n=1 Tax=Flavobacterium sp. KACC 22758 TaxID=3025667 RepID=UPI0023671565|nr:hypothetical protein [Flavobacterium sp. KACC 22758]WDF61612.1 hypothetical protein PQ462_09535 [Flavobacterium sp. KACC 22758]